MTASSVHQQTFSGVLYAIAAYVMWGVAPLYFKYVGDVPSTDILMHRIVWSAVFLAILLAVFKQFSTVKRVVFQPRLLGLLVIASIVLATNWLIFIWAVNTNLLLEASLGYYINPLFNVVLARAFLNERLRPIQYVAVGLAAMGVVNIIVAHGTLPWVAMGLAVSFSIYGLIRKKIPVEPLPGLFIETLVLLPAALFYGVVFASEVGQMSSNTLELNMWLIAAGVVTTAPLLAFNAAAKRILFSTLGLIQYIGPTLMFVMAVVLFNEPLEAERVITFLCVWGGLILFSFDSLRVYRKQR